MRRMGIISIHYGINFGSVCQAYALSTFVSEHFDDMYVEVINYIPPRYSFFRRYAYSGNGSLRSVISWVKNLPVRMCNNARYRWYLKSIVRVSPAFSSISFARRRYQKYAYLIAGSDQIWNSDYNEGIDPMYYLQFASPLTAQIAYAASSGKNEFTETEWDTIRDYLKTFNAISVREQSTCNMMIEKGINNCEHVCDPTFLLSSSEWAKLERVVKDCPDNYLLIYYLETNGKEFIELAKRIAKSRNLKTVLIINGWRSKKYDVDYIATNLTPDKYLWLFNHASFIVTNSFHGVSFSINFEKQFVAVRRKKYNTRLDSILSTLHLTNRYIELDDAGENISNIDYELIRFNKEQFVNKSNSFLRRTITNENSMQNK